MKRTYKDEIKFEIEANLKALMELWSERVVDEEYGGYLTCRNRDFTLSGTDKGAWGQARHLFTYSMMAEHDVINKERWLKLAKIGIDFVFNKMQVENNRIAYLTDREGKILEGPTSVFSDAFAIGGLAKYINVSGDKEYLPLLSTMFDTYEKNIFDPKFKDIAPNKYEEGVIHHAVFMISVNCAYEVASVLGLERVSPFLSKCLDTVLNTLRDYEYKVVLEKKHRDGSRLSTPDGLFMNTGHVFESMWFSLDAALLLKRDDLISKIEEIAENAFKLGTTDGLMTFSKTLGEQHSKYTTWKYEIAFEDSDRVCWGYAEAMVLFIYLYSLTGKEKWLKRFVDHYEYVNKHFIDKEYGDWFHALDFDGNIKVDMKGSTVKDAYHIPRAYKKILDIIKELQ